MTNVLFNTEDYYDDDPEFFECDWIEFKQRLLSVAKYSPVIFQGSEGLWNGRHKAGYFGVLENGLDIALDRKDDFRFEDRDGDLWLVTMHHDGHNEYRIRRVTPEGEDVYQDWEDPDSKYYSYTKEQIHDLIGDKFSENMGRDIKW